MKLTTQGQELEVLNDQKDKFFSFVAHNLKNPFNTIMGFAELMQRVTDAKDPEKVRQYSTLIYNLSSQVQKVLSNLLEWSRLQRRTFEFKPETLELNSLIKDEYMPFGENVRNSPAYNSFHHIVLIVYCQQPVL